MFKYCMICYEIEDAKNFPLLSCGCEYCKKSLRGWVKEQLQCYFTDDFQIYCPTGSAAHVLTDQDLMQILTQDDLREYETIVLKKMLLKEEDYRLCPMNSCNAIGWVDTKAKCLDGLICRKCKTKWNDPSLLPLHLLIIRNIKEFWNGEGIWSAIWKFFWVKYCPKCGSPIVKNGGCSHMNCQKCKIDFCWYCLQVLLTHNIKSCISCQMYTDILMSFVGIVIYVKVCVLFDFVLRVNLWMITVIFNILMAIGAITALSCGIKGASYCLRKWPCVGALVLIPACVLGSVTVAVAPPDIDYGDLSDSFRTLTLILIPSAISLAAHAILY